MFGISFSEIILIMILGLVIFGPEQLPQIAKKIGRLFVSTQTILAKIRQDIYHQTGLAELEKTKDEINSIYNNIKNNLTIKQPLPQDHIDTTQNKYYEYTYYQPELEFDRQPELFDIE